ncbi:hypothetical protein [Streptomyces sp. NPDC057199]|uniref:hypothetical protein n=1 Tax=Streptomyces sp. NPDC057199 TaxID=3346047 RepID=UPI0036456587
MAIGTAATLLIYITLLTTAIHEDYHPASAVGWVSSAAEQARPYTAPVSAFSVKLEQAATQAYTWLNEFALWPLVVLALAWLAHRNSTTYVRGAIALMSSAACGLLVVTIYDGLPNRELSFFQDYLALPGVPAGWYLLMAVAVTTTVARAWMGYALTLAAASMIILSVATTDRHLLAVLLAVVVPFTTWYVTGRLQAWWNSARDEAGSAWTSSPLLPHPLPSWTRPHPDPLRQAD